MAQKIKEIIQQMKVPCVIRQFYSGRELIDSPDSFDIIFLDIIIRDPDGMETARLFREKAFDRILIFMSSSREYVFDAYDVEAFQYLLKPVREKKLKKVLQRAVGKVEKRPREYIIVSRDVVERYNGVMSIEAENGIFRISVLLPLSGPHITLEGLFETGN